VYPPQNWFVSRTNLVCGTYLFKSHQGVTSPDDAPHPDLGLVDALAQLSFLVHNALAEIAAQHDLSIVQTRLLGVLRDREPTMNELGRHLGLDKSSVSGLVDRAQRRGLVNRTVSATDRRAFQVSITEAGRQLAGQVAARFSERIETSVELLPDTDRRLLSQLAARIVGADAYRRGIDPRTATG
jgi:MarR family transcriptional regulator, lower aerobic nicotinate degradation pathway regulator